MDIATVLQAVGLNENQVAVYITLLQMGSGEIQDIARKSGVKRTTAYSVLDVLMQEGLVSFVQKGAHREYFAEDPRKLPKLLEEEKRRLNRKQERITEALPELASLYNAHATKPKIRFYEGIDGIKQMFEETLELKSGTEMLAFSSAESIHEYLRDYVPYYLEQRVAKGIRQRAIAEKESATAIATADYLIGTFQLVNPATENPRTISAFEILTRSASRAAIELKDQPEILVRISDSLAQSYMNLGLYDEAASLLASRLPAINRTGAEGAAALSTLGETYLRQGKTQLARRTLDSGLRLLEGNEAAAGPAGDVAAARVALAMARVSRADGRNAEALALLDRALARLGAAPRQHPLERARLLHTKGLVLLDEGDFNSAQAALEAARTSYVSELGPRHRLVGENLYDQAQNAYVAGKLDRALDLANQSEAILSVILDTTNPFRAHVLALKGQILFGQGNLPAARAALDRAVAIYRQALGGPSYVIGISEVYLGLIASGQGDTRAALAYLDDAKLNYDASYGEIHPNHGDLLVNRAVVLERAGRAAEARQDCARGLDILVATLGADHSFTKDNRKICADLGRAG